MNKFTLAAILLLSSAGAMAADENSEAQAATPYQYGMNLDVKEVVSISSTPDSCKVEPATMVYRDHNGEANTLSYEVMGNCFGGA